MKVNVTKNDIYQTPNFKVIEDQAEGFNEDVLTEWSLRSSI